MKIIVGLATTPSRVKELERTLLSLSNQTRKPDKIFISVCNVTDKETLKDVKLLALKPTLFPKGTCKIVMLDEDYGPLAKLAGLLLNPDNSGPDCLLVTVDDNQEYNPKFIESLVAGSEKHPNCVVCLSGHVIGRFPRTWGYRNDRAGPGLLKKRLSLEPNTPVDVVSGWAGVAYPRSVFSKEGSLDAGMENLRTKSLTLLNKHDDLYVSAWLDKLGVKKIVIASLEANKNAPPVSGIRFVKEFWFLIRELRSRGLLASNIKVKWHKSTVFLASTMLTLLIAVSSVVAYCVWKKFRPILKKTS